jgi:hypothetical protein
MTPDGVCTFRARLVEGCSSVCLIEYLRQILFERSLAGWRTVRPRRRETIVFVLCSLVLLYAVVALVSTAHGTRCLVDPGANSCNGWVNH